MEKRLTRNDQRATLNDKRIGWRIGNLLQSNMTLEELRNICIAPPGATEDIKYGTDLCFSVNGKIFCGTRITGKENGMEIFH